MVKVTSTVALGVLALPLLVSALPRPIADNSVRDLAVDVRELDGLDSLDARGLVQSIKNDNKQVGNELKKVALPTVTASYRRGAEIYDELDARNIWQKIKNGFKTVGQTLKGIVTGPVGQTVAQAGMNALKTRDINSDTVDARDFDMEERFFDEELDGMYSRDFGINQLD